MTLDFDSTAGTRKSAVVLHGYSAANRGDGLLVDEAISALRHRGWQQIALVAAWPESFARQANAGVTVLRWPHTPIGAARTALALELDLGPIARHLRSAGVIVGVGGGYLRAAGGRSSLATCAVHVPQLRAATRLAKRGIPVIYLPQSVGPYRGLIGLGLRRTIRRSSREGVALHFRDDRSIAESLAGSRAIDMVASGMIQRSLIEGCRAVPNGPVAIVLRDVPSSASVTGALAQLIGLLQAQGVEIVGGLGSTVGRHNNDDAYLRRFGIQVAPLHRLLRGGELSGVVSVRLHGALAAWAAGIPAVHLGYERKSAAAYEDLGVPHLHHGVYRFDPKLVADQVVEISRHPGISWQPVARRSRFLQDDYQRVVGTIPKASR